MLDRQPSTKFDESGMQMTHFILKVEETGRDGTAFALWLRIEAYGKTAERAAACFAGDRVGVEGRLKWRRYKLHSGEDKSGVVVLARQVSVLAPAGVEVER